MAEDGSAVKGTLSVETETTTAVNRAFHHLHFPSFALAAFLLCALRTAAQQPLNIALVRKQALPIYNSYSTKQILLHIYRNEGGYRAVMRGMPALTVGCASSEVIYLTLLEYGREHLPLSSEASRAAVAGYVSDAACRLLHIPLSIVAYRQMAVVTSACTASGSCKPRLNWVQTLREMYKERGLRTVYAGLGTTLLIGSQWSAIWWPLYGSTKSFMYQWLTPVLEQLPPNQTNASSTLQSTEPSWWRYVPDALISPSDNAFISTSSSAFASALTAVIFNPFLVVRTNLQVQHSASLLGVCKRLYHQKGVKAFYRGVTLSVTTCVLDGALASLSYEYARLWADVTRRRGH